MCISLYFLHISSMFYTMVVLVCFYVNCLNYSCSRRILVCRILYFYHNKGKEYFYHNKGKESKSIASPFGLTFERVELYLIRRGMVFSMAHFVLSMLLIKLHVGGRSD